MTTTTPRSGQKTAENVEFVTYSRRTSSEPTTRARLGWRWSFRRDGGDAAQGDIPAGKRRRDESEEIASRAAVSKLAGRVSKFAQIPTTSPISLSIYICIPLSTRRTYHAAVEEEGQGGRGAARQEVGSGISLDGSECAQGDPRGRVAGVCSARVVESGGHGGGV